MRGGVVSMAEKSSWQVKPEHGERRYRRIDTRLWHDRRFLSFNANGRTVWLFLLTNPRTTSIPGLFPLHEEEAARLCGLTLEGFRDGFAQPFREGMVEADWGAGLVWLRKAARYEPPTGPNVVAAWRKVARMDLPECSLLYRALAGIREQLREVLAHPEPFLEAFAKAFAKPIQEPMGDGFLEGYRPQDAGCRMQDAGVSASQATAVAAPVIPEQLGGGAVDDPPPADDLPDATDHAEPVSERPTLELVSPAGGKKPREPSKAERLYSNLQGSRCERCAEAGVTFVDDGWKPARMNRDLGALAKLEKDCPEAKLLNAAWAEYLADETRAGMDVPWSLGYFLASRAQWEGRALKAAGGAL